MPLLTEQEIELVGEEARRSLRLYQSGVRGQQVTPLDDPDYHLILATEKAVIAKIKAQGACAKVDANDDGHWADILPNCDVKVGQLLYPLPKD